jgi:hypothetical protein
MLLCPCRAFLVYSSGRFSNTKSEDRGCVAFKTISYLVFRINKLFCTRKGDFFGRVFEWAYQG